MLKRFIKTIALSTFLTATVGIAGIGVNTASAKSIEYLPGDFHQHSYYTDGSHVFMESMAQNNIYLQWWANSEHGGMRNRDGEGNDWTDKTKYPVNPILGDNPNSPDEPTHMYRWQSLRDYVYPEIMEARDLYPDKTIINGLEWNVPGHEHCSTAIHQPGSDVPTAISEFEYRFDKADPDTSRNGEDGILGDALSKTNSSKDDAISAVTWMQDLHDSGIADAWVVPAHIERARAFIIEDFRNWQDAGPDVAVGFEGAPGHQTSGTRGFGTSSVGGGTYGGSGYYSAIVGGLWDAMSAEGRKWFNFASSDDHSNWRQGGSDFWPGEYQKNYTAIDTDATDKIQAVFDGIHSGNSWHVMGDLIDKLHFTAKIDDKRHYRKHGERKIATMGETLTVKKGDKVQIKIKVHDPLTANNCPLNMDNPSLSQIGISQPLSMPELDHIDLIAGTITGNAPATNLDNLEATDYQTDAAVIRTFERREDCEDGNMTYVINIKPENSMFIRLRGTNLPADVPFETDEAGNPLRDSDADGASANIYDLMDTTMLSENLFDWVENVDTFSKLDEVAEAYADLWFYSNPIYINVVE